jgi:hypothetical protein
VCSAAHELSASALERITAAAAAPTQLGKDLLGHIAARHASRAGARSRTTKSQKNGSKAAKTEVFDSTHEINFNKIGHSHI